MPEENDPPQSALPNPPPPPSWNVLAPEESSIGGAHGKPGSGEARRDWTPPTLEEAPALFSGYEVLGLLGRGGMGAVYQARQIALSRLVAIKLLPLEISVDKDFADRFRREAHAMARLNHPNIIAVHDFGATSAGHLYFVMEYVDGANLAELIRLGALDAGQALLIVEQVCTALAYAHGKGIVHRDIKPANVMIDTESRVKVADFGLARLTDTSATDLGHTPTSAVMGTPDYMAPEQMHGMNVDQRADIYSLGVILYEMLCREVPRGSFDLPSHRTGCDARIDQIVIRATQQSPDRRYQSTQEMKADLTTVRAALAEDSPAPASAAPAKSKTRLYAAIAMGVIVLAAVAFFLLKPKPEPPAKARAEVRDADAAGGMRFVAPQASSTGEGGKKVDGGTPINRPPLLVSPATPDRAAPSTETPPANATREQPFVNTLGMKFVPVPILGGPTSGQRVLFSIWDTRVQDYEAFVKETKREWPKSSFEQGPTHPAVNVSWEDAQLFCQWLTTREQVERRLPTGWSYRLPSDHEWSCAVGIPGEDAAKLPAENDRKVQDAFPWGAQWPPPEAAGNYASEELKPLLAPRKLTYIKGVLPGYHDGYAFTSPVGSYAANRFGLFDIGGNVGQLCQDWFDKDQKDRVSRGAPWSYSDRSGLQSSYRGHPPPTYRGGDSGFRCVLAPAPSTAPAAQPSSPAGFKTASNPPSPFAALAAATLDSPFINSLGMKFVPVPILGGPTGGQRVLFSIWDTRVQDYDAFVKETKRDWPKFKFEQGPTHPAVNVSWEDAQLFCRWLTNREQVERRLPAGWSYRLPSDHEWSCAVGIPGEDAAKLPAENDRKIQDTFPWGTQWPPPEGAGNYASAELKLLEARENHTHIWEVIPGYHDGYATTSPVGSYAANRFGLFDMGGNVSQWCEDWYDKNRKERTIRGGSWGSAARYSLLSSKHNREVPTARSGADGVRCVIAPIPFAPPAAAGPLQIASSATTATVGTKNALAASTATPAGATTPPSGVTPAPTTPQPVPRPSAPAASAPSTPPSSPAPKPATEVEKWFAQVDGPQEEAFQKQVQKPYEAGLADLRARYLASADAAIARASVTGQLAEALAWRTEREAFGKTRDVAADDAGTPVAVKTLRAAYREQLARLQQDRLAKAKALLAPYDAALAKNQTLLTHRQRLDDALLLKNKREAIALAWLGPSPPATAGAAGRQEPAAGAAGFPDAAKPVAAQQATREKPFVNSLGMRFVPVPIIGGPTNGKRVLFSIWDTRVQDYEPFAKETKRPWPPPEFEQGPTHPAVNESWEDARAFCAWLTETERASGSIGGQDEYRLPSDHEWSCAVGIGAREKAEASPESKKGHIEGYPWGTRWPPLKEAGNYAGEELRPALAAGKYDDIKDVIAGHRDDFVETAPVGSFPANRFGLFDMGGNVWQWCGDWYDADQKLKVMRGASWKDSTQQLLRSSWRDHVGPTYRGHETFGFRCILAPSGG